MEALLTLATKLQALSNESLFSLLMDNERTQAIIVQLLKERQLEQGVDGQGQTLPLYVTNAKGMLGQPYNLFDTGEFYESIRTDLISKTELEISGDTVKQTVDLMAYGDLLNLNENTMQEFIDVGLPILRQEFIRYLLT